MNTAPTPPHPLSFQPKVLFSPGNSSASSNFPYKHAVPAQQVQPSFGSQSQENSDSFFDNNGIASVERHEAIAILQNIPRDTIFAWLHGFRSVLHGEQWFPLGKLTPEQRRAVSALRDCSNDLVRTWLDCAQSHSQYSQTIYVVGYHHS